MPFKANIGICQCDYRKNVLWKRGVFVIHPKMVNWITSIYLELLIFTICSIDWKLSSHCNGKVSTLANVMRISVLQLAWFMSSKWYMEKDLTQGYIYSNSHINPCLFVNCCNNTWSRTLQNSQLFKFHYTVGSLNKTKALAQISDILQGVWHIS